MLSRQVIRSAHSAAAHTAKAVKGEQVTKLANGLTVASVDNFGPLSQLVLAFRAGSRYQSPNENGLVHHIRNSVGSDSEKYPGLSLVWSSAVAGGNLTSFASRDLFGVSLTVPRDQTSVALSILGHVAAQPAFKPWDVEEVLPSLNLDISYRQAYDIVLDGIHQAAYRNGNLANSPYAEAHQVGKVSFKTLQSFAEQRLVSGQAVLFGSNIEHDRLVSYGDNHAPIRAANGTGPESSPYKGGDFRKETGGKYAHVILAGAGAAGSDAKAVAVQSVLLNALGQGAAVQFSGSAGNGAVAKAVGQQGAATAFQSVHQDAGLAGVYLVAEASKIAGVVSSAANAIKNFKASDIESAKRQATNDALRSSAHSQAHAVDRAGQLLSGVQDGSIVNAIQTVTASDVEAAAKKIASKFSVASTGNVHTVPYADSI
ncbi:unnamed protein product [Auanema sp. JU1783]|nr:unnamed protein product [Auanema sp. JU1783]